MSIPSSSARRQACIPPAPPNATSVSSRGSTPRSTLITLKRAHHLGLGDGDDAVRGDQGSTAELGRETPIAALGGLASQDDLPAERRAVGGSRGRGRRRSRSPRRRRARSTPARAPRPPIAARRAAHRRSSTQAIDPPPALTVCTSTIGCLIGMPPTIEPVVVCTSPSSTSATSVLVPPMSKVRRSDVTRSPRRRTPRRRRLRPARRARRPTARCRDRLEVR